MPNVVIEMIEGRTLEQKRALVESVTKAVCNSLGVQQDGVRIRISEMSRDQLARGGTLHLDRK